MSSGFDSRFRLVRFMTKGRFCMSFVMVGERLGRRLWGLRYFNP